MQPVKVALVGVGPFGQIFARHLAGQAGLFRIVAAMDADPNKSGLDLGTVCGLKKKTGIAIAADYVALVRQRPQVAVLTTVSSLQAILPQLEFFARAGISVISTCEELVYPWPTAPAIARRIDRLARRHQVAVLGAGINPGFLMDLLPLLLSAVCCRVERIRVSRVQNATCRREPFQRKIGVGLTRHAFEKIRKTGLFGHVGLSESMNMIAARFDWQLDKITTSLTPVLCSRAIKISGAAGSRTIERGQVAGIVQSIHGYCGKNKKISLYFRAAVNEANPHDSVEITGEPTFVSTIPGGLNGDVAASALLLNVMPHLLRAEPGLRVMTEMPLIHWKNYPGICV